MIEYNKMQLGKAAKEAGLVRDTLEKVLRLKEVLFFINKDQYLQGHLVLKGGTAINMTIFNLPRLSVDIDMDFTPNLLLEELKLVRRKITELIEGYMIEEGYQLSDASRYSHSLASLLFQYQNASGNRDNIKIEINYSLRSHSFKPTKRKVISDILLDECLEYERLNRWKFLWQKQMH